MGCKYIGIWKSEFVAKTQFLSASILKYMNSYFIIGTKQFSENHRGKVVVSSFKMSQKHYKKTPNIGFSGLLLWFWNSCRAVNRKFVILCIKRISCTLLIYWYNYDSSWWGYAFTRLKEWRTGYSIQVGLSIFLISLSLYISIYLKLI